MRWSTMHIPTLRDDPADAGAPSHRLLLRAGYIRQLMAGHYSLLPLGQRVRLKVIGIIREEMDRIGAQEFLMPVMHPAELWIKSGRWELMGDELFRLKDRKGADFVLGMTHEEIISTLATELESYRELPQLWYQFQTKLRDEPRPKAGLMRTREFTMKDSYSFDLDAAGLDASFLAHRDAYVRIFERLVHPGRPGRRVQRRDGRLDLHRVHLPVRPPARISSSGARSAVTPRTSRRPRPGWPPSMIPNGPGCSPPRSPSPPRAYARSRISRSSTRPRPTGRSRPWSTSWTACSPWSCCAATTR